MNLLPAIDRLNSLDPRVAAFRRRAFEFTAKKGLPTKKDEDWRYTSVKPLTERAYASTLFGDSRASHAEMKEIASLLTSDFHNIVFVNGRLDRTFSSLEDLPADLQYETEMAAEAVTDAEFSDVFEALNAASLGQGLRLSLRADATLEKPVRLHFHTVSEDGVSPMIHPRILVTVGDRASLTLVESHAGTPGLGSFTNSHTEIVTGTSSRLAFVLVQEQAVDAFHMGRLRVRPGKDAEVLTLVYTSGARIFRHSLEMLLDQTGVTAQVLGAVAVTGDQHADNTTEIDHRVGGNSTVQDYKALLDGDSRSAFTGRVRIRRDAQKASSEQLNKNLLLSRKSEADSRPMLMIEADDVKATHGSTVGQLSAEELFYLMSRGLSRSQSISLLSAGFLADVLERLPNEVVRNWLVGRLNKVLERVHTEGV